MYIDVFNGDADGICALVQWRLAYPAEALLISGTKREIELLQRVHPSAGDQVTVLDVSLAKNRTDLLRILEVGAAVLYVDHHLAGDIPQHPGLTTVIDPDASCCSGLLMNQHLQGQFPAWAVVAAFGDNMDESALQLATTLSLTAEETLQLKTLGVCINYNGYGATVSELHFAPDALYRELVGYASPLDFIRENAATYEKLVTGYEDDLRCAIETPFAHTTEKVAVTILPDAPWSRRVSGVFGNELANRYPQRAHAVLTHNAEGGYLISVRSPLTNKTGADELCSAFATGGGRKSAAGINHLPKEELGYFIQCFAEKYR